MMNHSEALRIRRLVDVLDAWAFRLVIAALALFAGAALSALTLVSGDPTGSLGAAPYLFVPGTCAALCVLALVAWAVCLGWQTALLRRSRQNC